MVAVFNDSRSGGAEKSDIRTNGGVSKTPGFERGEGESATSLANVLPIANARGRLTVLMADRDVGPPNVSSSCKEPVISGEVE